MKCREQRVAAPCSICGDTAEGTTAAACSAEKSPLTHTVTTHAAPSRQPPPLRRHLPTHMPLAPSHSLSRYVEGLAAGEDLADLIRGLHSSFTSCYRDCVRGEKAERTAATAAAPSESLSEVDDSVESLPVTPHPLPRGSLTSAERGDYFAATKTALLFAAESPAATEAATILHCSAVTRSVLFPYYYPTGHVDGTSSEQTALPFSGVLRRGAMDLILSDIRMVELAREAVRHNPRDGWQEALRLLHGVAPTPLTCAVEVDLYRQTGGHHWQEALRCLWTIPTSQWTEMDVGSVLRCLYHAGRRHAAETTRRGAPRSSSADAAEARSVAAMAEAGAGDVFLARLIAQALRVHRAVEEAGSFQWSAPSAFNDTLGLVATDPTAWRDACLLLDKLLAAHESVAPEMPSSPPAGEVDAAQPPAKRVGVTSAAASSALYRLMRPNAVTVHQTCRALRQHWATGLRYVQQLQTSFGACLRLTDDIAATEDVLRLCIVGQRWQEALEIVTARHAVFPATPTTTATAASSMGGGVAAAGAAAGAAAARTVVTAELASGRRHYRPDIFVQLVRLLGSEPAARPTAHALVQAHATAADAAAATAGAAPEAGKGSDTTTKSLRTSSTEALSQSKHYNRDTLSRAYNSLVQGSSTLEAADAVVRQLHQHHKREEKGRVGTSAHSAAAAAAAAATAHDRMLAGLETESLAHIAYLSCIAGNWERALHHTNTLLHAPRYRATYLPTSRLHDAVQYALEQAPAPGPSWEVSLRLFSDMMDRSVPNSEVAFKSAVKRCFAGGAPEQAQRLFHLLLKMGVRS